MDTLWGIMIVSLGGLVMGSMAWPIKFMKQFEFEHWWFVGMLVGLFIVPWTVTLLACPDAMEAYRSIDTNVLIRSNLFSLAWGIANVLLGICFVRIGVSLSFAILTGVGVSLGVTIPMIFKASGQFQQAAGLGSPAGLTTLIGVGIMFVGLALVTMAGFGRDRVLRQTQETTGNFLSGLMMCVIGGVLSCGISFAFIYSQGPIVEAMKSRGAGEVPANLAVWAVGLIAGGLVNIIYPAFLLTRNKSWGRFRGCTKEIALAGIIGVNFIVAVSLMGKGMLYLGILGASVGFGVQQAMQILGGQILGFVSGEWRGVTSKPRFQMISAVIILLVAATVMAYANTLAKEL